MVESVYLFRMDYQLNYSAIGKQLYDIQTIAYEIQTIHDLTAFTFLKKQLL